MQRRVDWTAIRAEYITSNRTHAYLSAKYGVHAVVIGRRAARERWTEEKAKHRNAVVARAAEESALQVVEELAKRNLDDLAFANDAHKHLITRLKDFDKLDAADIRRLLESAAVSQKMARVALGVSPENEVPVQEQTDQDAFDFSQLTHDELEAFHALFAKAHRNGAVAPPLPGLN